MAVKRAALSKNVLRLISRFGSSEKTITPTRVLSKPISNVFTKFDIHCRTFSKSESPTEADESTLKTTSYFTLRHPEIIF